MATAVELYDAVLKRFDGMDHRMARRWIDVVRVVIELHKPVKLDHDNEPLADWVCRGCDLWQYSEGGIPDAPCSTLKLIAERLGVSVTG